MSCGERSERARRLAEELMLILYWSFYYGDTMTARDQEIQNGRRDQLMRELLNLRSACRTDSQTLPPSRCHLGGFFGKCEGAPVTLVA